MRREADDGGEGQGGQSGGGERSQDASSDARTRVCDLRLRTTRHRKRQASHLKEIYGRESPATASASPSAAFFSPPAACLLHSSPSAPAVPLTAQKWAWWYLRHRVALSASSSFDRAADSQVES